MTREETDRLLDKLNQMLEKSDKAISIWTDLMEQGKYPKEDCLKQIDISNQQKSTILKMIEMYGAKKKEPLFKDFGFMWWIQFVIYLIGVCIVFGVLIVNIINSL